MRFQILVVKSVFSLSAVAGTSADYQLAPAILDGGGGVAGSEDYQLHLSVGGGRAGSSPDYGMRGGFAGQLLDAVSMHLDGAGSVIKLGERASRPLGGSLLFDDGTTSPLAAERVRWSIESGPLQSISSAGLLTAGSVYQSTPALLAAAYLDFVGNLEFQVLNIGDDDFGTYAADGLSDRWQVAYFGEENEDAGPTNDTDSDGLNHLQEFAFGTDPTQSDAGPVTWSGALFGQGGTPTPFVTTTASSFSFRAVFARRRDHVAAGLSYTVEFSGDLSTWRASTATPTLLAQNGEIQAVSVPYPFFVNGKKARFFRVKVQKP
jgi:hypothetical protein